MYLSKVPNTDHHAQKTQNKTQQQRNSLRTDDIDGAKSKFLCK